jgi:hypothetical protein
VPFLNATYPATTHADVSSVGGFYRVRKFMNKKKGRSTLDNSAIGRLSSPPA